ncbi:MAG: acyltransferase [Dyadobacter sp.]|uniref:acyltransferase family protein n=1 Tax=Dyadobacter sp. TaxID=1914288 RepID=UPI003263E3DC
MREQSANKASGYFPQLDGLRALAISLVIAFHWFPENLPVQSLCSGQFGVTLFFVLSGFLITGILLKARGFLATQGFAHIYRSFMIRRILRIFPVYYFVILVVWIAQYLHFLPPIETEFYEYPLYYLAYCSNFLIDKFNNWSDVLSIYWTLAVEEQFYIFWPIIILKIATTHLKKVIIACIAVGILSRLILEVLGHGSGVLMPTCLDSFGLGALWSVVLLQKDQAEKFVRQIRLLTLICAALFILFCFYWQDSIFKLLLFRTSMSVLSLYLVITASFKNGFKSVAGKVLGNKYIGLLGKISYGIYVYHMLVPDFLMPILLSFSRRVLHMKIVLSPAWFVVASLALLLATATSSWLLLEVPFRRLKNSFQVQPGGSKDYIGYREEIAMKIAKYI